MSYCVNYNFGEKIICEDYNNLSWEELSSDDIKLINTEYFENFYDDYKEDIEQDEDQTEHKLSLVGNFRDSQAYNELEDTFIPLVNYIHILQREPISEQIELVSKYASVCAVVSVEDLGICGLALTGCGMDFSDSLELAYYLIDGVSPITAGHIAMGEKSSQLLKYCREVVERDGSISFNEIQIFLNEA